MACTVHTKPPLNFNLSHCVPTALRSDKWARRQTHGGGTFLKSGYESVRWSQGSLLKRDNSSFTWMMLEAGIRISTGHPGVLVKTRHLFIYLEDTEKSGYEFVRCNQGAVLKRDTTSSYLEEAEEAGVRGQGTGVAREAGGLAQLRSQTPHPGGHRARGCVISLTNNILSKS